jgi:glucan biosynthesis protein C
VTTQRIYGLDAMRAILLMGGPLVHAADITHFTKPVGMIVHTSGTFRMATFFVISGFIVASLREARHWRWLMVRARQLVVPILATTVIMALFNLWHDFTHPAPYDKDVLYPLHLWFLIALAIMSPLTVLMDATAVTTSVSTFINRHPQLLLAGLIGATIGMRIATGVYKRHYNFETPVWGMLFICQIPKFALYYIAGFILARSKLALDYFNKSSFVAVGVSVFVLSIAYYYWNYDVLNVARNQNQHTYFLNVFEEFASAITSVTIVILGVRMKNIPSLFIKASKTSYTIYLFHMPIILFLTGLMTLYDVSLSTYPRYLFLATISTVLSVFIHLAIRDVPIAMFLFNGRPLNLQRATQVAATTQLKLIQEAEKA